MQTYKAVAHSLAGCGGLHCPCCKPSRRYKKRFFRMVRRVEKRLAEKELDAVLR